MFKKISILPNKKSAIFLITFFQLGTIVCLLLNISQNWHFKSQKPTKIYPVSKESIVSVQTKNLKYFYQLASNKKWEISASWLPYSVNLNYNSDGLNDRYNYTAEKPVKTYRIISLGDSITYGAYVNTSETYSERIEDALNASNTCSGINKYDVLNFGVFGYDIQYMSEHFRLKGNKYSPDLVILLLKDDDFNQIKDLLEPISIKYRDEMERNNEDIEDYYEKGDYYPYTTKAAEEFSRTIGEKQAIKTQTEALYTLSNLFEGKILVVTFSSLNQKYKEIINKFKNSRENIYYHDQLPELSNPDANLADGHPSPKGHQLISQSILEYIHNNNIIHCDLIIAK